jgi:acetyltransferase-like isoleucine patch superfamily enzyme
MSAARARLLVLRGRGRVRAAPGARAGRRVRLDLARGARVTLGRGAALGAGTRLHLGPGAQVVVADGARLGERCVIAAHERVVVDRDARLGDEVVLVDFDHAVGDVERPVREQGLVTAPVVVGAGTAIDAAAVVLRGVTVGPGARVGVRSVVTGDVPPGAVVGGVPARPGMMSP